ncbi:MAG: ribonuclease HII [Bacteroidota bacterium]|nr:ribonuclease HII [Bacteroidota bacterium]MDP4230537.1 ribonuclease HII [Bacteroidota bacterium]MDP4236128.1 ribonuclease HII [Bacteroidota bacterium]
MILRRKISWKIEREYLALGQKNIIGIDEAGRGPLAGPVVAAAVLLSLDRKLPRNCFKLNDSKQLTAEEREDLYEVVCENAIAKGIGIVSAQEIDEINILRATMKAMTLAVHQLEESFQAIKPEILLIDGNYFRTTLSYPFRTIVDGDGLSPSIAAASILAKVTRDKIMHEMHEQYPEYNFKRNKGYATVEHREAIGKYGQCFEHRKSFKLKEDLTIDMEFED